jgi:shikimate kinase
MKDAAPKKTVIFLTGFMGSGKSTIGPILANTIGFDFIDLDAFIEQKVGRTIGDIFKQDGEARFREIERSAVRETSSINCIVVSLGGGTVAHQPTLDFVKQCGVLVYLKSGAEQIFKRLRTKSDRPMLRDEEGNLMDHDQLLQKINDLIAKRSQFYEQADIIIQTDERKIGDTVDDLVKKLRRYVEI